MKVPFMPPQASSFAGRVDYLFLGITLVALAFSVGVAIAIIAFAVRYRRGNRVNRVLPGHEGIALELTWTIIPLIIAIGLFVWSTSVYFSIARAPKDAMQVYVVGKQWMWKLQQPNGRWEMNELHIPLGKPVKLTMISEDVIHDFGIPAFRVKMDVVPGRYTEMWFQPTQTGRFHIFCSQYCGTNHAIMGGYVHVMEPAAYQRWLSQGNVNTSLASSGERLFRNLGCTGCHGPNASVRAPNLEGIYNQNRAIQIPGGGTQVVKADYRYLHDSIILPEKEIAAGYQPIMPSFKGRATEEEILQIIDYIKSLGTSNGTSNGLSKSYSVNSGGSGSGMNAGGVTTQGASGAGIVMGAAGDNENVTQSGGPTKGNPTGDMANILNREAIYGGGPDEDSPALSGGPSRGNPTGDMANILDREAIYRGGSKQGIGGSEIVDNSAGGLRADAYRRPGLNPYGTLPYAKSSARNYTGLQPGSGVTPPVRGTVNSDLITGTNQPTSANAPATRTFGMSVGRSDVVKGSGSGTGPRTTGNNRTNNGRAAGGSTRTSAPTPAR
jgi:cytochrome c oxidase subunit 2